MPPSAAPDDTRTVTADRTIEARKAALSDTQRAIYVAYVRAGASPADVLAHLETDMGRGSIAGVFPLSSR